MADLNVKLDLDIYCLAGTKRFLESPADEIHLTQKLSKLNFISELNDDNRNEAEDLVKSLKGIEEVAHNLSGRYFPDLSHEDLTEEEYKTRIEKIGENLKKTFDYMTQSKFLSVLVGKDSKK